MSLEEVREANFYFRFFFFAFCPFCVVCIYDLLSDLEFMLSVPSHLTNDSLLLPPIFCFVFFVRWRIAILAANCRVLNCCISVAAVTISSHASAEIVASAVNTPPSISAPTVIATEDQQMNLAGTHDSPLSVFSSSNNTLF